MCLGTAKRTVLYCTLLMVFRIIPASPMPTTDWPIRGKGGCLVVVQGRSAHYLPISGVIPVSISNLPFDY